MQYVVSAFPGCGKSSIFNNAGEYNLVPVPFSGDMLELSKIERKEGQTLVFDSDSSNFDKAHFPGNYISYIKSLLEMFDNVVIFVSSHIAVREALAESGVEYVLVYPEAYLKQQYLERYTERGSPEKFIELLSERWLEWVASCDNDKNAVSHYKLTNGQYLSNIFENFK